MQRFPDVPRPNHPAARFESQPPGHTDRRTRSKGEPVSKLLVLVIAAAVAAFVVRSKRSGGDGLRSRAKDAASTAGEKLSDAHKKVEETVRS